MSIAVLIVALVVLALTNPFWWPADPRLHRACALVATLLLTALWVALLYRDLYRDQPVVPDDASSTVVASDVVLLGLVAVLAGGPVTSALLSVLEEPGDDGASVLRGGAWIGVLERAAVFLAVVGHHPAAIAVVVAVKGLGRYPELQSAAAQPPLVKGAAERFIAGTLASLLWAGTCAMLAVSLVT